MSNENEIPEGWETSSGLAVDDADITIDSVVFRYDGAYNNGETLVAAFTMRADDGEEIEQFFPCGKGWEPADKGGSARHESGKAGKAFNKNSAYGTWCNSVLACGAGAVVGERGPATQADVWDGLKFHVEAKTETFTIGDEKREATRIIATAFLGDGGDAKKTPAKSAASSSSKAENKKAESNGNAELSPAMKAKLVKAAKEHDTHDAFMEAAFGIDGVLSDSAIEQIVMDTSDEGLYATARA